MWTYRAVLVRAVDGDTLVVDIDLGFEVTVRRRLRLAGLDCPAPFTEAGRAAREAVVAWFAGTAEVVVRTQRDRTEKYGRYLAEVLDRDGRSLNGFLVESGLAFPWDGRGSHPGKDK